jgi:hypothetical protein
MTPKDLPQLPSDPFTIDVTDEDILESLLWPYPPPGRWPGIPPRDDHQAGHIDAVLERIERAA